MFWKTQLVFVLLVSALVPVKPVRAQQVDPPLAPNWCAFSMQYIEKFHGKAFTCAAALRCVKMNNYGCVKQSGATPLPGTTWGKYRAGAFDKNGHALFEHPKFSLLKMIATFAHYQRDGLGTALAIQERYAPWCDTLGSAQYHNGWGRSCRGERRYPAAPVGYKPMCERPPQGVPTPGQCSACNCPNESSKRLVRDTGISETAPLALFDKDGRALPIMATILRNQAFQEQGITLSTKLTQEAVDLYNQGK